MAWRARELGKARFLELSAEVMTGGMLVYRFTIEAEVQTGEHGGSLIELAEPIVCAEYEMDEVCNNRFAN